MISKKRHQVIRAGIKRVVPQHIRDAANRRVLQQDIAHHEVHRVVENRVHSRIDAIVLLPTAGKERSYARVGMEHFADRRQLRIDFS